MDKKIGAKMNFWSNIEGYFCIYAFFDYAVPRLKRAMQLSAEKKNPSQMMDILIREERKKYQTVGRNDPCPCGSGRKFKQCCGRRLP